GRPGASSGLIGYLPQRRSFDAALRIRGIDIVRLGVSGARWGVPLPGARRFSARARAEHERVEEVIDLVGASAYAHRPIGRLYGTPVEVLSTSDGRLVVVGVADNPSHSDHRHHP